MDSYLMGHNPLILLFILTLKLFLILPAGNFVPFCHVPSFFKHCLIKQSNSIWEDLTLEICVAFLRICFLHLLWQILTLRNFVAIWFEASLKWLVVVILKETFSGHYDRLKMALGSLQALPSRSMILMWQFLPSPSWVLPRDHHVRKLV